jgi:hypothetical protein
VGHDQEAPAFTPGWLHITKLCSARLVEGVKYGYRLATEVTRRDVEGFMAEMRAELSVCAPTQK